MPIRLRGCDPGRALRLPGGWPARERRGVLGAAGIGIVGGLAALALGNLSGCAALPAAGLALAVQATQVVAVAGLSGIEASKEMDKDRCTRAATKGVVVTETLEATMPVSEGDLQEFGPLAWRTAFARDGYPGVDTARRPIEARLALTKRSVTFVADAGSTSVRIPLEVVEDVEVRGDATARVPEVMVVRSCEGRFDIVALPPTRDPSRNAEATAVMAGKIKAAAGLGQAAAGR